MKIDLFDDRKSWLAARGLTVGGSDAPCVLGLSPYRSPLALWSMKLGLMPPADETNILLTQRMRIGHHVETAILGLLAEEADLFVEPVRFGLCTHPRFPELTYSPDGLVMEKVTLETLMETDPIGLAEVKNRAGFDAADDWSEDIPRDVYAQVQHGLDVTGLPQAWVGVLLSGREFRWARVKRDDEWIEAKRPALLDFARRLRENDPPEPTGSPEDRRAIVAKFPAEEPGKVVPLPGEAIDLAAMYRDAKDAERKAKLAADEAANKLALLVGDAERGQLPGDYGHVTFATTHVKARVQEAYAFRSPRVYLKKAHA